MALAYFGALGRLSSEGADRLRRERLAWHGQYVRECDAKTSGRSSKSMRHAPSDCAHAAGERIRELETPLAEDCSISGGVVVVKRRFVNWSVPVHHRRQWKVTPLQDRLQESAAKGGVTDHLCETAPRKGCCAI